MMLRPGVFLQDRYEILEQIGSGGMSVVYKAKCHKLNRLVAIKVLKEEFCNDSTFVSKFKMEAQAAAGLAHPNIVNIYDVVDEGKIHYIVMELIEGITLKTYIARKGQLEIKESIGIAIQVAQGIAAAHEQHIIHRDIKPQNMLISRDGKVKVADFGIARAVSAQTMGSAAMGSVHYISPEQARGGFSDERSDIYSLGITIYEMVTGHVPFDGENTVAVALAHLENTMIPPSVYNPEVPVSLERIIYKCTEKKPERRYKDAGEVISDLRRVLVSPEDDFVAKPSAEFVKNPVKIGSVDGATVQISDRELTLIKEASPPSGESVREYARTPVAEAAVTRRPVRGPRTESRTEARTEPERRKKKENPDSEVSPQIERLLAGAGVVVAVLIVAVLVVVFAKLGGVFKSGSGIFGNGAAISTQQNGETSEENSLSDTEVYMPNVLDLSEDLAQEKLKESSLNMKRTYEYFDNVEKGNVVRQEPEAGTIVPRWSNVNVVISNGSDKIDVTSLGIDGMEEAQARRILESRKLTVVVSQEESETVETGKVIRYEPEMVPEAGTVTLYVSTGPHVDRVPVPQLAGKTEEEAIALLAEAGLIPGDTTLQASDTVPRGSIISQSGGENGQIEVGGKISYVVSSGPAETEPATVSSQRYVASIDDVYDMSNLIGPGAGTTSITLVIRLHQTTNGKDIYKELTGPKTVKGDVLIPISYTRIESMNGSDEGEVEVVDIETGNVLKSYRLTFFPMD